MKIVQLTTDNREHHRRYEIETPYFGTAPEALLQGFAALPEVEVHVVTCTQRPMRSPEKLADNIFFHSLLVPKIGWLRTGYQGCIRATRKKIRELNPDIVHGQGTERDCSISAVFSGRPNVLTIHGNMRAVARVEAAPPFSFNWCAARLEAFTLPRADGIICITQYTREIVGPLARKSWIVPNAVDASFFDIARSPVSPPRLLCVGSVDTRKNQNALIRALDPLQRAGKFEVLFLGKADPQTAYGKEFLGLVATRPWCRFEGFAGREALKAHFAEASGVVLPSKEDNCPMVVLEAMAAGVPVAAADVGGVPELVRQEETGLLLDPLDPASIVSAVSSLLADATPARAVRAKEEALRRFHPKVIAQEHLKIYRKVAGKKTPSS